MASHAARRLVVVTGEPTSLTDGYAFIKTSIADTQSMQETGQATGQATGQETGQETGAAFTRSVEIVVKSIAFSTRRQPHIPGLVPGLRIFPAFQAAFGGYHPP